MYYSTNRWAYFWVGIFSRVGLFLEITVLQSSLKLIHKPYKVAKQICAVSIMRCNSAVLWSIFERQISITGVSVELGVTVLCFDIIMIRNQKLHTWCKFTVFLWKSCRLITWSMTWASCRYEWDSWPNYFIRIVSSGLTLQGWTGNAWRALSKHHHKYFSL